MKPPSAAFPEVTGAILTGGTSRRLGRDKVLLPYQGKPLVLHIYSILKDLFPKIFLIGHPRPELEALGLACFPDRIPGKGALGGLYTALNIAAAKYVFVAAADMPFLTADLISGILSYRHDADAVIPKGPAGPEPLCAVYSTSCIRTIEHNLGKGSLKIISALEGLTIRFPEIEPDKGIPDPFFNINYPEDLEALDD
jgi:molybdopterin-guanine dinucleotide biosynthesis protein A